MKIIQFINALGGGGAEVFASQLSVALNRDPKNEVYLITYAGVLDDKGKMLREYVIRNGVHYIDIESTTKVEKLYKPVVKLNRLINQIQPDVVHSHLQPSDLYMAFLRLFNRSFKNIRTLHNPRKTKFIPKFLDNYFFSMFDHNVGCSLFVKKNYPDVDIRSQIKSIDNGIDLQEVNEEKQKTEKSAIRNQLNIPEDSCVFINVGSMYLTNGMFSKKNQHLIIESLALLPDNTNWFMVFVGDGPLRKDLEDRCLDLGIRNRVLFTGLVKSPYRFIFAADYCLMPSSDEGLPISLIESVCSGLPSILSSIPAFKPFDADSSQFLESFDKKELAQVLGYSIENKKKYGELGEKNIHHYMNVFDIDKVASKYMDLYNK